MATLVGEGADEPSEHRWPEIVMVPCHGCYRLARTTLDLWVTRISYVVCLEIRHFCSLLSLLSMGFRLALSVSLQGCYSSS